MLNFGQLTLKMLPRALQGQRGCKDDHMETTGQRCVKNGQMYFMINDDRIIAATIVP